MAVETGGAGTAGGAAGDGATGAPPARVVTLEAPVALDVDGEKNTLAAPLRAVASVPVEDVRFEFSSSFLLPDATRSLERMVQLRARFPDAPLTVFGHADRVGDEAYNKKLSGRRARSVYGALIHEPAIWEELYQAPLGADDWRGRPVQYMLLALGFDPGPIDGLIGNQTKAATRAFQQSQGLPPTGSLNPTTREALFTAYMDVICRSAEGVAFRFAPTDFLGGARDAKGKVDYQGCGEFNPIVVPPAMQENNLSALEKNRRDFLNAPNRRVTVFFMALGAEVVIDRWPCPRASEGPDGCRARFWSDSDARLLAGGAMRRQRETHDTYGCRFYERLTLTAAPNEGEETRSAVQARWSKHEVVPVQNSAFPPATPPTDAIPDDAKVDLVVDTQGMADGTPARIEIRHAHTNALAATVRDLEVRGNEVIDVATGARPVWSFEADHQPWEVWDRPYFYLVAFVGDEARGESPRDFVERPEEVLRVRAVLVTIADAIADTPAGGNLTTEEEMDELGNIQGLDPARDIQLVPFNQNGVPTELWGSVIRNTYAYHQTSHGDMRCRVDGDQFDSSATSFPTVCPNDPTHPGRSTLFIGSTPFGDAETNDVANVPSVPRYLVYINTCVAGFEPSFANALMARGTRSVIAFRKYIPDDDAREMARQFYRRWAQIYRCDPERISEVFDSVSAPFWDSMRPVLFGGGAGPGAAAAPARTAVGQALGALA